MGILKEVKIKLLDENAKVPYKATEHSSGYDLCSNEEYILKKGERAMISTGISLEMEPGLEAQVRPRSGLAAKSGITVLNSPGTIDSDYRGEVKVILINLSDTDTDFVIEKGMRIAQMVFGHITNVELITSEELQQTQRGAGGFGSTGVI